ncbi:cytochrome b5-related protein-like [Wyeomyia smithii]|uniref:cytochrome b5-related protein-like n=1 Tax=Wyeomyia smithii TaxID=174621 RepID=UPI0024680BA1|nr:cytochrome b5-related protein-like [Wyeomyia smithii]XP_055547328.1 cytochrome b5-related protein-like [Wyeomyia smithii]
MASFSTQDISLSPTIITKPPAFRNSYFKTVYRWLDYKRLEDGAEGLWRIHDTLYDLTQFIDRHPGGAEWLQMTKGTDITEAFETHHISNVAEMFLPTYKVRMAKEPRNIRLTFDEKGFYRTLKGRVAERLDGLDLHRKRHSEIIQDSLVAVSFFLAFLAVNLNSILLAIVCGFAICWVMNCAHNFFHRRDNWRILVYNMVFLSYREQRISHVLSHHMYPNSVIDLEITLFEPFLCWLPEPLGFFKRYVSWIYEPVVFSAIIFSEFSKRIVELLLTRRNFFHIEDIVSLLLPIFMYATSSCGLAIVFKIWLITVISASFFFGFYSKNAAHHHPDVAHAGDLIPSEIDFGVYQLLTVIDRSNVDDLELNILTSYGHHSLHHMFPTLDHCLLPQLFPVFLETCAEFHLEHRRYPWWRLIMGQFQQLACVEQKTHYVPKKDL